MTEVIRIGPYAPYVESQSENFRYDRSLGKMENEMRYFSGFEFSFEDQFRQLAQTFSNTNVLKVFDSGCGEGRSLWDIKDEIGPVIGKEIDTTGISMIRKLIRAARNNEVNTLIVGSLERYADRIELEPKYHFLLDYHGAMGYIGVEMAIPIYTRMLIPRARALLLMSGLGDPEPQHSGEWYSYEEPERLEALERKAELEKFLAENNFLVLQAKSVYALLEKQ